MAARQTFEASAKSSMVRMDDWLETSLDLAVLHGNSLQNAREELQRMSNVDLRLGVRSTQVT